MLILSFGLALTAIFIYLYKRYVPVFGVKCLKAIEIMESDTIKIIDVRDFNYVQNTVPNAVNIPVAYITDPIFRIHQIEEKRGMGY